MGDWIEAGQRAPAFTLTADDGTKVRLADLKGRPVVLYFYPRDDTPGCTREACAFRDQQAQLKKLGAVVLGVSTDSIESHGKFRDKYELNFPLLADADHAVAEKYGAWREKNMYGKKSHGHPAEHVPHRRGRQGGQGVEAGEGRRPRRAGARSAGGA